MEVNSTQSLQTNQVLEEIARSIVNEDNTAEQVKGVIGRYNPASCFQG
ncbi:MAG: hypothetical protein HC890_11170 [Chloroflexaceae bacterium]|nr:hypothetical protein [Chloroflexaceae bacterium]